MSHCKRFPLLLLSLLFCVTLLGTLVPESLYGVPRTELNEHFDKNQQIPVQRWPWFAPVLQDPSRRWHYNPQSPYYRNEGPNRTDYSWGLQDYIYNNLVMENEEFHQALWCAYTNRDDINNPNYPEDDDYQNNQNAWVWWGGLDLSEARSAEVNFWVKVDLTNYNYDSLTFVAFSDYGLRTSRALRNALPIGVFRNEEGEFEDLAVFNSTTEGWINRTVDLSDLRMLDRNGQITDSVSMLGRSGVFVAWVWQTNGAGIVGKGAFLDDVTVQIDDGLPDIQMLQTCYGYRIGEDSIYWSDVAPTYREATYFRADWRVIGEGEPPEFRINCTMDGEVIATELRQVVAGGDTTYTTTTAEEWIAAAGRHTVRWILDADSTVEESDEANNSLDRTFEIDWTPAPAMAILSPSADSTEAPLDMIYRATVSISDSNETDSSFTLFIYFVMDTSEIRDNPWMLDEMEAAAFNFRTPRGESSYNLELDRLSVGEVYFLAGLASDGVVGNTVITFSQGSLYIRPAGVKEEPAFLPVYQAFSDPYPNPFNGEVRLDYSLPGRTNIWLAVYDLTGREVAVIDAGMREAGVHSVAWRPVGLGGGVYLAKLRTAENSFVRKVVYTP